MSILFIISIALCILGLVSGLLMFWRLPVLHSANLPSSRRPFVSVIIPARNEERRLRPLLTSLSLQEGISFETLVIDDDSQDQTSAVAHSYNVRVIRNKAPKAGWIGKSAACWTGAQAAKGKLLLFMDADTAFEDSKSLLRYVSSYEEMGGRGLLSLQPYHTIEQLYENASIVFNIIVIAGMNVFTPFKNRFTSAGAFGPCILCDRSDYDSTGGHAGIHDAIMDDLALGEAFHAHNLPVHCYSGKGLVRFRMYPEGMGQLLEGWTKNFGTAAKSTHPFVMTLISSWIAGGFMAPAGLGIAAATNFTGWLFVFAGMYIFYSIEMTWLARRTGNFPIWISFFYPILLIFFTGVFLYSLYLTRIRKTVSWRGRNIHV